MQNLMAKLKDSLLFYLLLNKTQSFNSKIKLPSKYLLN
jgi:hypothetical protein